MLISLPKVECRWGLKNTMYSQTEVFRQSNMEHTRTKEIVGNKRRYYIGFF